MRVVDLGPVRVDADLHLADAEIADAVRFTLAHENRVGLELDVEPELARIGEQLEEVLAEQQLSAAEDQEQRAFGRELVEHVLDFGGGQLAVIVVIEIAVHAALVAAVGEIELHRQRHAVLERAVPDLLHQDAHAVACRDDGASPSVIGRSEVRSTPSAASAARSSDASRSAVSGVDLEVAADHVAHHARRARSARRRLPTPRWRPD